jgi:hypothetical protein
MKIVLKVLSLLMIRFHKSLRFVSTGPSRREIKRPETRRIRRTRRSLSFFVLVFNALP